VFENVHFQFFLDGVGELHARMGEKFNSIVLKGIMRGGDDHASLKVALADEASDAGSGDNSGKSNGGSGLDKASGKNFDDVRAGFAGVHADKDISLAMFALEISAEGAAGGIQSGVVERRGAGDAANSIGSKKFFRHRKERAALA